MTLALGTLALLDTGGKHPHLVYIKEHTAGVWLAGVHRPLPADAAGCRLGGYFETIWCRSDPLQARIDLYNFLVIEERWGWSHPVSDAHLDASSDQLVRSACSRYEALRYSIQCGIDKRLSRGDLP